MKSPVVLGIDCSTTACKAIAWDAHGAAKSEGRAPIALDNPEPDGWEQDASAWWVATQRAISECVSGLDGDHEIRALAVTHQRETFVLADAAGTPLAPAIVWMDSRGREQVTAATQKLGADRIHELSGKPPCITPSLYKLLHLFDSSSSAPHFISLGVTMLLISAAWQLFDAIGITLSETLRAAGDTAWTATARLVLAWVLFVPAAYVTVKVYDGGPIGAMLCLVAYIALLAGAFGYRFRSGAWRNIQLIEPKLVD